MKDISHVAVLEFVAHKSIQYWRRYDDSKTTEQIY